jgi:hypothetical protein
MMLKASSQPRALRAAAASPSSMAVRKASVSTRVAKPSKQVSAVEEVESSFSSPRSALLGTAALVAPFLLVSSLGQCCAAAPVRYGIEWIRG